MAILKEYVLRFHKRSIDGSGKCNAFYTGNQEDEVVGVIFRIDDSEKPRLDRAEGLGHGYNKMNVDVVTLGGVFTVLMYVADSAYIDESLAPYTWYKEFVVEGAKEHGLPERYIEKLEAVRAGNDLDEKRDAEERRLLPCRDSSDNNRHGN